MALDILGCLKFCVLDYIVKGWLSFPIYLWNCCWYGCECVMCWLPLKKNCSTNGRFGINIPFVFEIGALVFAYLAWTGQTPMKNAPFGWVNKNDLLAPNVTYYKEDYREHMYYYDGWVNITAGDWSRRPQLPLYVTLFDRGLLESWTPETIHDVDPSSIYPTFVNGTISDFIAFTATQMCIGETGHDMTLWDQKNCKTIDIAAFKDIPVNLSAVYANITGLTFSTRLFNMLLMLMSITRILVLIRCKGHLMRPGSQWMGGFYHFLFAFMIRARANAVLGVMTQTVDVSTGSTYHVTEMKWTHGAVPAKIFHYSAEGDATNPIQVTVNAMKSNAQYSMLIALLIPLFSSHAYCTDCTTLAYAKKNRDRVRRCRSIKQV